MAKLIQTAEGSFRMRRGVLVRIPDEWVGQTTHPQSIRKRQSKQTWKSNSKRAGLRKGC